MGNHYYTSRSCFRRPRASRWQCLGIWAGHSCCLTLLAVRLLRWSILWSVSTFSITSCRIPISEPLLDTVNTFSESPWPQGTIFGTPRGPTVPPQRHGPALPYEGFEKCGWYRKLTLTIYLLSLAVAGDLLYTFPFLQNTSELSSEAIAILNRFMPWFALNILIVWLFATIALQWPVCNRRMFFKEKERLTSSDLLGLMLPNQNLDVYKSVNFYKGSKGWTILAWMGVLLSVTYDVLVNHAVSTRTHKWQRIRR